MHNSSRAQRTAFSPTRPFMSRIPEASLRPLLFAALSALALAATGCKPEEPARTTAPKTTTVPVREPFDAHLTLANNAGRIDFGGAVADEATRDALDTTLQTVYPGGRANGAIEVDAVARAAAWSAGLEPVLRAFEAAQGAALRFEGDRIVLSGQVADTTLANLRETIRKTFPNAKLEGLLADAENTPVIAELQALAAAPNPDAVKLTRALNLMPVRFDEGKGNVSESSLATVAQAAKAIAAAPPGTRLRIVGPIVATKDAGNDVFLSKQRAEAIKAQLILSGVHPSAIETRGWGQNPDGSTPDTGTTPPPPGGAPMRFELLPARQ
ncbi:MAG: OmpA family protein [Lysobacter sp.]|nr:OmpA family protein [Lysobacter sp.]